VVTTDEGILVAAKELGTAMSMVHRDGEQCACEDVTVVGEQSREDALQKHDCPAILCSNGSRGTCCRRRCACSAGNGMQEQRKQREKGEISLAGVPERVVVYLE
jgi:hypothetical protein